ERNGVADDAAAVDARPDLGALEAGGAGYHLVQELLQRVLGTVVAVLRPAVGDADGEEAGVLPRAVVPDPAAAVALVRAACEVGLRRPRPCPEPLDGRELRGRPA